mgnify:CR=1 FL=1
MKICLYIVGKTKNSGIEKEINEFKRRIEHYVKFEINTIIEPRERKNYSLEQIKKSESELILAKIEKSDFVVLLDERGKEYTSNEFASFIQLKMNSGIKKVVFIIGGAYGFGEDVYKRANELVALSKLTFSHQIVRLIFIEQLYRAFTIIKGEPYHH